MKTILKVILLIIITQPVFAQCGVSLIENSSPTCYNGNDGALEVSSSAWRAYYAWSTGASTARIEDLSAGLYTVTVTCDLLVAPYFGTEIRSYQVTNPLPLKALTYQKDVSCYGGNDGHCKIQSVINGTPPIKYTWSNGSRNSQISNLWPGAYTCTISDDNGCQITRSFNITEPGKIVISTSILDHVACHGGSDGRIGVSVSGGTPGYAYNWSNGATGATIMNLKKGLYHLTVTDNNSCTRVKSYVIDEPNVINRSIILQKNVSCFNGSDGEIEVSISGGTPPYSLSWSNGDSGPIAKDLSAGVITLSILDENKCTKNFSFTITQPTELVVNQVIVEHNPCYGDAQGEIEVNGSGGTAPYTYTWSNGATTPKISGLPIGTYDVTITDDNDCESTQSFTITQPTELVVNQVIVGHNPCYGDAQGEIEVNGSGGTAPYTYTWSNGATTSKISGLPIGTYDVTITDDNDCESTQSFTITQPTELVVNQVIVGHNPCYGDAQGEIEVNGSGGTAPYTYTWSNGVSMPKISGLKSGKYTIVIKDANGCGVSKDFEIEDPEELEVELLAERHNGCDEVSKGALSVEGVGGTPPYSYQWSNGATTSKINGLVKGVYGVEITDHNGCNVVETYEIRKTEELQIDSLTHEHISCHGEKDGFIEVILGGGTPPYIYDWSTGDTTETVSNLEKGIYSLYLIDFDGCERWDTFEILEPDAMDYVVDDIEKDDGSGSGHINITPTGGIGNYDFNWSGPNGYSSKEEDISGLYAGDYMCTIMDENECIIETDSIEVKLLTTSISEDLAQGSISVYPNPTTGQFCVKSTMQKILSIHIYTLSGHLAKTYSRINSFEFKSESDLNLSTGTYFIKANMYNGDMACQRLIVN